MRAPLCLPNGRHTLNAKHSRDAWQRLAAPLQALIDPLGYALAGIKPQGTGLCFAHPERGSFTLPTCVVRVLADRLRPPRKKPAKKPAMVACDLQPAISPCELEPAK